MPSCAAGPPGQPAIRGSVDDTIAAASPTLAAARAEAPASRPSSSASSGAKEALTIGQVAASAPRMDAPVRQAAAFGLLAQKLGILLGEPVHHQRDHDRDHQRDGRQISPAVSKIAAVMMAPYIPAARRRPRFFAGGVS